MKFIMSTALAFKCNRCKCRLFVQVGTRHRLSPLLFTVIERTAMSKPVRVAVAVITEQHKYQYLSTINIAPP